MFSVFLSAVRRSGRNVVLGILAAAVTTSAYAQTDAGMQKAPTWSELQSTQRWATATLARSTQHHEWVTIPGTGRTVRAWMTYPEAPKRLPIVLVLHEVFGLTDSTRATADQVAAMGYLVIVPDMLSGRAPGGGNTDGFENSRLASDTLTGLPDAAVEADLNAWADYAAKLGRAKDKLAVVGLSWGGGAAFRYATSPRKDLKGVFVFYDVGPPAVTQGVADGASPPAFPVDQINVPVYGFYPSRDLRVMASLPATEQVMKQADKRFEPVIYTDADHAYMRLGSDPADSNPANAQALLASLRRLRTLLRQTLG